MAKTIFNANVHVADENGDPKRTADGEIQKKQTWQKDAIDRQNRKFNPKIHAVNGKDPKLDDSGYLIVKRRDPNRARPNQSRTEALVADNYEEGYAYYMANDDGGRLQQMEQMDWEPVTNKEGAVGMPVGQARAGGTQGRLFRKPKEWYDADQLEKRKNNETHLNVISSPKEEDGQYEATANSPLR